MSEASVMTKFVGSTFMWIAVFWLTFSKHHSSLIKFFYVTLQRTAIILPRWVMKDTNLRSPKRRCASLRVQLPAASLIERFCRIFVTFSGGGTCSLFGCPNRCRDIRLTSLDLHTSPDWTRSVQLCLDVCWVLPCSDGLINSRLDTRRGADLFFAKVFCSPGSCNESSS